MQGKPKPAKKFVCLRQVLSLGGWREGSWVARLLGSLRSLYVGCSLLVPRVSGRRYVALRWSGEGLLLGASPVRRAVSKWAS